MNRWGEAPLRLRVAMAVVLFLVFGTVGVAGAAVGSTTSGLQYTNAAGKVGPLGGAKNLSGVVKVMPPATGKIKTVSYYIDDVQGRKQPLTAKATPFVLTLDTKILLKTGQKHSVVAVVTDPTGLTRESFARFSVAATPAGARTAPVAQTPIAKTTPVPKTTVRKHTAPQAVVANGDSGTSGGSLDLTSWKLTMPISKSGGAGSSCDPLEVTQPELKSYKKTPWFTPGSKGITFRANAGGCTTENSSYPRSELREMTADGSDEAAWSMSEGTHTLTARQAITHLPKAKPQVVSAQIHDAEDDIIEIMADGSDGKTVLGYRLNGKFQEKLLDDNYKLGTPFDLQIVAAGGKITIKYNGQVKAVASSTAKGNYFKAGAYTQSNTSKGDEASAYGEVVIYSLDIKHTK